MIELKEYKLAELCNKVTDGSHFSPKAQKDGYPMFSVKDMLEFGFDYSSCKRISKEDYEKMLSSGCVPQKDDILVAKDGSYLKQIFRCKETKEEAILSSIAIFRPNKDIITPSFLCYLLKSPRVYNYISNNCVSGSALPRIVLKSFKEVKMQIPPLSIQRRIASILSSLDSKIETNNKINAKLEEMAQALFKSWFVDFEPFKDKGMVKSELGMIPEGWTYEPVANIATKVASGGTPKSMNSEYYQGKIKWYSTKELKDSFLLDSEKHISEDAYDNSSAKIFPRGTVLMAIYAAPTVGRLGILSDESCFNQAAVGILPKESIGYPFIYLTLKSERINLNNLASGAAQQNLNVRIVKEYKILVPPSDIINQFNKLVFPIFENIETNQKENLRLTQFRDTLLPKLMSGEIEL